MKREGKAAILSRATRELLSEELWLKQEGKEAASLVVGLPGCDSSRQRGLLERCSQLERPGGR